MLPSKNSPIRPKHDDPFDIIEPSFTEAGITYTHHSGLHRDDTAFSRLLITQRIFLVAIIVLLAFLLIVNWHATVLSILGLLSIYYIIQTLFDLFLSYRSMSTNQEIIISEADISNNKSPWPKYTILCPLYKEEAILPQFISAMQKLDYPSTKLQILLLFESNDIETIRAAEKMKLAKYFKIIKVPQSNPQTKPKALNYGIKEASGKYLVIYDAEDIPDADQLKKTAIAFSSAGPEVACIQSKLDYYNKKQNLLTRLFTAEYSLWFSVILPGLQSIKAPIPLGGTSNHFEVKLLKEIGGWDAFNVTEDADLGIRLAKRGFRTSIINSVTYEEASSQFNNWFKQRRRWVKGYIQTLFVHTRKLGEFNTSLKRPDAITFQLVIGGKVALLFINPLMLLVTIIYFSLKARFGPQIESFFPAPILYLSVVSLLLGNFLYAYYYMIGCAKREHWELMKFVYLVPLYWIALSAAAYMALYDLIVNPHHWHKTLHGQHLDSSNVHHASLEAIGKDHSKVG